MTGKKASLISKRAVVSGCCGSPATRGSAVACFDVTVTLANRPLKLMVHKSMVCLLPIVALSSDMFGADINLAVVYKLRQGRHRQSETRA